MQMLGLIKTWESYFSLFWIRENGIISPRFGKGTFFADDSNLANLVGVQRLRENGK